MTTTVTAQQFIDSIYVIKDESQKNTCYIGCLVPSKMFVDTFITLRLARRIEHHDGCYSFKETVLAIANEDGDAFFNMNTISKLFQPYSVLLKSYLHSLSQSAELERLGIDIESVYESQSIN